MNELYPITKFNYRFEKKYNKRNSKIFKKFDRIAPANHVYRKRRPQCNGEEVRNGIDPHMAKVSSIYTFNSRSIFLLLFFAYCFNAVYVCYLF